jgi:hypothetical protein
MKRSKIDSVMIFQIAQHIFSFQAVNNIQLPSSKKRRVWKGTRGQGKAPDNMRGESWGHTTIHVATNEIKAES